ncbi:hypothetical protein BHE74_00044871 [Ensete ventricosum]|nr:hypothetical protein BHE74_00044871 [Ensete ventricosum]
MVVETEARVAGAEGNSGMASTGTMGKRYRQMGHAAAVEGWRWRCRVEEEGGLEQDKIAIRIKNGTKRRLAASYRQRSGKKGDGSVKMVVIGKKQRWDR